MVTLRSYDFKSISEYNSAMFRITSQLKLCGKNVTESDMLEKTFSTFHASNMLLQQQYREKGFTKYSELISCLLVAEQNNELLMKNHEARPCGSAPFPEVNMTTCNSKNNKGPNFGNKYDKGKKKRFFNKKKFHKKWENKEKNNGHGKNTESRCHRCGGKGHWARTCRTPKHLVELYQASLQNNEKKVETNFVSKDARATTHYDVSDFFEDPEGNIGHLINNGNIE